MAVNAHTKRRASFKRAFDEYQETKLRLAKSEAGSEEARRIDRDLADQVDELLDMPAGSIAQVIAKLYILWDSDLDKPDRDAAEKALIIDDLHVAAMEISELAGFDFDAELGI